MVSKLLRYIVSMMSWILLFKYYPLWTTAAYQKLSHYPVCFLVTEWTSIHGVADEYRIWPITDWKYWIFCCHYSLVLSEDQNPLKTVHRGLTHTHMSNEIHMHLWISMERIEASLDKYQPFFLSMSSECASSFPVKISMNENTSIQRARASIFRDVTKLYSSEHSIWWITQISVAIYIAQELEYILLWLETFPAIWVLRCTGCTHRWWFCITVVPLLTKFTRLNLRLWGTQDDQL